MISRKVINEDYKYRPGIENLIANQRLHLEVLLDIRDQNEEIKNLLNSMKTYSANSNDINISKIWDEGDNEL